MSAASSVDFHLEPEDSERLANLCGPLDRHLRQIELGIGVEIFNRGHLFRVVGEEKAVRLARSLLERLYQATAKERLGAEQVHLLLQEAGIEPSAASEELPEEATVRVRRGVVRARGPNQRLYLQRIAKHDLSFGVGPAGTGKTYLAVASAVQALEQHRVSRLILVRPAVEAGEKLGFLPGDLAQKVDPYLRPLYDALYEMLGFDRVAKLMERNVIEVAPSPTCAAAL